LICTHGWPWTFWHWSKVIDPLADPGSHGGDVAEAFEVIVPSVPGFGFSTPLPNHPDMNFWKVADLWHTLMTRTLGYDKYGAAGCDVGVLVTGQLGHKYADELYAIHIGSGQNSPCSTATGPGTQAVAGPSPEGPGPRQSRDSSPFVRSPRGSWPGATRPRSPRPERRFQPTGMFGHLVQTATLPRVLGTLRTGPMTRQRRHRSGQMALLATLTLRTARPRAQQVS
jgi:pimeloyl-ACP methyl ester carboxylesterase